MLTIISIFCNAEDYIDNYFKQIDSIEKDCFLILLEGNSQDKTYTLLNKQMENREGLLLKKDYDKVYPSIVSDARFQQLTEIWNSLIELIPQETETIVLLESDLIWTPEQFKQLYEASLSYKFVCPLIIKNNLFYDFWAYRLTEDEHFQQALDLLPELPTELYSAGSFLMLDYELLGSARLGKECFVTLCTQIKKKITCLPIYILHP